MTLEGSNQRFTSPSIEESKAYEQLRQEGFYQSSAKLSKFLLSVPESARATIKKEMTIHLRTVADMIESGALEEVQSS